MQIQRLVFQVQKYNISEQLYKISSETSGKKMNHF